MNKRIAIFFATSGHSGNDRIAKNLVPSLAKRGYFVDVLKVRNHGPNIENISPGVRIVDLGARHTYSALLPVISYLRRENPVVVLADKDRVNRTALLARWIANTKTRLVLGSGTTISIDLKSRGWFERRVQKWSMGNLYPFADSVLVLSKGAAEDMSTYTGLDRNCIRVVPCPVVSSDLFEKTLRRPDHPWFQKGEPPVILGVGELGARKDFSTLIRGFHIVNQKTPCRLVILGSGKEHHELIQLTCELGIQEKVDFPGFQPDPYPFMAHAGVFSLTSRWEGLGFVLIEALAVGTPVVSTDCPSGPREILQNGQYGALVPIGNADSVAQALLGALANPPARSFLQEAARPYEIEKATNAYLREMNLPTNAS